MSLNADIARMSERDIYTTKIRIVGTGASAPTEVLGANVAITYTGVGEYKLTFASNPGIWCGPKGKPAIDATAPADVKNYDAIFGAFTAATATADAYVTLYLYTEAGAAHDLAALEWITADLDFKRARS